MRGHCPRFDQGATVRFGAIEISKRGFSGRLPGQPRLQLAWAAVRSYRIEKGMLVIETSEPNVVHLSTSKIPNLAVLLHVFEQLTPKRTIRMTIVSRQAGALLDSPVGVKYSASTRFQVPLGSRRGVEIIHVVANHGRYNG